ncbi:transcriptional regulator [Bacillus phage vB_BanS-Thrax3]|nr:transcriptional regulator [Bacillus phage vB_BanS-Thrax1]UUV46575.1 transcriptional regulator [Bacillus phage vB_BanS-Thrax3]
MSRSVEHKKDIKLNREKLQEILNSQKMGYIELHEKVSQRYGLDLQYKGFMSLMSNKSSWKLLYAHAIADVLRINYNDIFEIVDVEKKN